MTAILSEQISYLTQLRHDLHRQPEISGQEEQTAARIVQELKHAGADRIWATVLQQSFVAQSLARQC